MTNHNRLSVVIPCWHDELELPRLLTELTECSFTSLTELQVIVVDSGNSELCREICRNHNATWVSSQPNRGLQLRFGASLVESDLLWFLHADAKLTGDPIGNIRIALQNGAVGGYFAFRFAGKPEWQGRLLECLINLRNTFGVPYGDQGIFVRRSAYLAAGQHASWPLFEEVPLIKGLRGLGRVDKVSQGLLVNPRRWHRDGWWRRSLKNRVLALGFALGIPAVRLAKFYAKNS
ncbi:MULTISPECIES: glycosyltransferase [Pseudomonas]|uniref:Glycosyltransferase n=2 Tax=Pseudomonas TaxID=286 RepID=A0A7X1GJ26_9PSED|nr:glycosyltransferase [Pseudomonas shahriarae]MBC2693291.1 glycosyltransferase [Pseudomonas kielensis]MDD1011452.1 glycosyltransferase [Pseudomonas shahriarae]MDZ4263562.1 glycosyltransferase [Pseudomonadota bacterium]